MFYGWVLLRRVVTSPFRRSKDLGVLRSFVIKVLLIAFINLLASNFIHLLDQDVRNFLTVGWFVYQFDTFNL